MAPMKVLYFHQHFSTPAGAVGIRSYEIAHRLVEAGHSVTMVCGSYAGGRTGLDGPFVKGRRRGIVDGIDVIEFELAYGNADGLFKRTTTFMKYALRSVLLALTQRYDVLFATSTPLTAAIPGIAARWLRNVRFVFEVRDLWPELPKAMGVIRNRFVLSMMSVLEWAAYKSAHRLIGLSPGMVAGIVRRGIPAERVAMIPNGCDFDIFSRDAKRWRPDGVTESDLMALFAGTHGQANGLDAVLDAAAELVRRGRSDIRLVLVGDGKLKPGLQRRAAEQGLHNVLFLDPIAKTRLAGLVAAADIGLQILDNVPAFYEGTSPNKFFDYIATGLPVLINYPGWLAGKIVASECGYAVQPGNPAAFADALIHAADNRHVLPAMGERARELALAEFDRSKLVASVMGVLEEAAAR